MSYELADPKHVITLKAEFNGNSLTRVVRIQKCDLETFKHQLKEAWDGIISELIIGEQAGKGVL